MKIDLYKLKPKIRKATEELRKDRRYEIIYDIINNSFLIYILFTIFSNVNAFSGYFSLRLFLDIIFTLIIYLIISKVLDDRKKIIKKKREKVKSLFIDDICDCSDKCNCRENLIKYLKKECNL